MQKNTDLIAMTYGLIVKDYLKSCENLEIVNKKLSNL